jgi:hypothetical protein
VVEGKEIDRLASEIGRGESELGKGEEGSLGVDWRLLQVKEGTQGVGSGPGWS